MYLTFGVFSPFVTMEHVRRMADLSHKQNCTGTQLKYGSRKKAFGQLVALGFGVAAFTPAPYQRPRLGRP